METEQIKMGFQDTFNKIASNRDSLIHSTLPRGRVEAEHRQLDAQESIAANLQALLGYYKADNLRMQNEMCALNDKMDFHQNLRYAQDSYLEYGIRVNWVIKSPTLAVLTLYARQYPRSPSENATRDLSSSARLAIFQTLSKLCEQHYNSLPMTSRPGKRLRSSDPIAFCGRGDQLLDIVGKAAQILVGVNLSDQNRFELFLESRCLIGAASH